MVTSRAFTSAEIRDWLTARIAEHLGIPVDQIDPLETFENHGLSSREAVGFSGELEEWLGRRLPATLLWDYSTIEDLAGYLASGRLD